MKRKIIVFLCLLCIFTGKVFSEETAGKYELRKVTGNPVKFTESWGYVMMSRANEYNKSMPLTDVCYFGGCVDVYGELADIPSRNKIDIGNARAHLVINSDSRSLTHFILDPTYGVRNRLIKDIVKAAETFDGVQLDFEYIPKRDRENFIKFIADLRYNLKGKILSVCVPARFKLLKEDMYPYAKIADYCDKIFVMCYDEHWSTSKPGAIASMEWSRKVVDYAVSVVPEKKLVMGIPFYGRTWANKTTSGAWYFSGANRIMRENDVTDVIYDDEIPRFTYKTQVTVTGYFNDAYSDVALCRMYEKVGVKNIGFWRIGQEDPDFWKWLEIK